MAWIPFKTNSNSLRTIKGGHSFVSAFCLLYIETPHNRDCGGFLDANQSEVGEQKSEKLLFSRSLLSGKRNQRLMLRQTQGLPNAGQISLDL